MYFTDGLIEFAGRFEEVISGKFQNAGICIKGLTAQRRNGTKTQRHNGAKNIFNKILPENLFYNKLNTTFVEINYNL